MFAHLKESGIETLVSWPKPLHQHQALGLSSFKLPMTEHISREVLSLPMYPELSDEEVSHVIAAIREFYSKESPKAIALPITAR